MKKILIAALLAGIVAAPAFGRSDPIHITLQSVLDMPDAKGKLDGSVKFYLAGAAAPKGKKLGEDTANNKTNAFNKTPEEACRWAALSALIKFQDHAKRDGADAVVDLVSYNKRETFQNGTEIECLDGTFVGGITLKGTYLKTGK